ncbi:MAG: hypothetical protein ACFFDN_36945 [Candidatus Hodarchaeota archaeon]
MKRKQIWKKLIFFLIVFSLFSFNFISYANLKYKFKTNYKGENLLKSSDNEISIVTPENKTYTQPMSGYYPATYGFENDVIGTSPQDWNEISEVDRTTTIEETFDDHRHVLKMWDNTASHELTTGNNFQSQSTGKVEFWWAVGDIVDAFSFLLVDVDWGIVITIRGGYFQYRDSSAYHPISGAPIPQINKWYHIRIDFRCNGAPAYEGLNENRYFMYIDGTKYGEFPFVNNMNSFTKSAFSIGTGSMQTTYVDAIGYSWDPNYNIGDNLNEGLFLNFNTIFTPDWLGYSLDGLPIRTILGDITIPFLSDGSHSIQVFGNDTLGTKYESELRHFSINVQPYIPPDNNFIIIISVVIGALSIFVGVFLILYLILSRKRKYKFEEPKELEIPIKGKKGYKICSYCHNENRYVNKYCVFCGASFTDFRNDNK